MCNTQRVDETDREIDFYISSSPPSTSSMSVIANATNSEVKREFLSQGLSRTGSSRAGRTEMVLQQSKTKQWETYSALEHGHSNSVRCGQTRRLGSPLSRFVCKGDSGARKKANLT